METPTQLEKVRKVSKVVKTVCKILLWVTVFTFVLEEGAIIIGQKPCKMTTEHLKADITWTMTMEIGGTKIPLYQPETGNRALLVIFIALVFVVAFKAQYHLYRLFANYAAGNIFTAENVAQIKQLGVTLLLVAGLQLLAPFLAGFFFGAQTIATTFPVGMLLTGGLVILISWVMDAARGLREENETTI